MSGQPDQGRLVTAAELLAHAQSRLDQFPTGWQARVDQGAEELRALFALRKLPLTQPVLLGFAAGVAEHARLLDEHGGAQADRSTRVDLRNYLLLLAGRLAQAGVQPATLDPLIDPQPPADGAPR
jgi:hypothetical protein